MKRETDSTSTSTPSEVPYGRAIPEPSAGPLVTALGLALVAASIVLTTSVLVVGALTFIWGSVLWFRAIFPDERLEAIPEELLRQPAPNYAVSAIGKPKRRPTVPEEMHPIRSGVRGGLLGGMAMAIVACLWGISKHNSVWLPINLLTGSIVPGVGACDLPTLESFHPGWFAIAIAIHLVMSVCVGLLYTTALPMMPRRPLFAGGVLVPVIVTGLVWASLGIVNPALERYISWSWFIASQVAFGLVCGWIVSRSEMVSTRAGQSLAERLSIERGSKR
ncbi:MAG: hypothetical protein EXS01_05860 [Phycisphaerales bacterium]|nr:hypothetical protein [Phycisphaerales bacterium]